jgi:hypothetical protein
MEATTLVLASTCLAMHCTVDRFLFTTLTVQLGHLSEG